MGSTDKRLKTVIFSGTTEGRQLSERLIKNKIPHTVCVATQYGELMCTEDENVLIKEGRLNDTEMSELFSKGTHIVIDATHPFALEVSANIKKAAKDNGLRYIRVLRDLPANSEYPENVRVFDTLEECVEELNGIDGNILFTTGSKDLESIVKNSDDLSRVYVRVLPIITAIEACENAGLRNDHIIAMHGPFSCDINTALMKQFDIVCLVSKESGRTGGLDEKLAACKKLGLPCYLIKRPAETEGVSVDEADKIIADLTSEFELQEEPVDVKAKGKVSEYSYVLHFDIVGAGPGNTSGLTIEGAEAVRNSDILFGAGRLIDPFDHPEKHNAYLAGDIADILKERINNGKGRGSGRINAAVLFSGDIGFYSGASGFEEKIKEYLGEMKNVTPEFTRFPGISSVSAFAAKLAVDHTDALILSLHKKNTESDYESAAEKIACSAKTFVLLSGGYDISLLAMKLLDRQADITIYLGERLSYKDESIVKLTPAEAVNVSGAGLYIAYIINYAPHKKHLLPYICDAEFLRDKTPMTKELIRHEVIRRLELCEGDVFYDVGSGTGSVSIEAAKLSDTLRVVSFEKKDEAIELEQKNIERFGCGNIEIVKGEAPDSFKGAPTPDCVFIGGSGGRLHDILTSVAAMDKTGKKDKKIRVVITAVTLETMCELGKLLSDENVENLKIEQITTAVAKELGAFHLLSGANPVMIASFVV